MRTLLVFLLLATSVEAAEIQLANGIIVSDAVAVPPPLPGYVMSMSDSEYRDWALAQNAATLAAVPPPSDHVRYKTVFEQATSAKTRFGGGVGYGGYGGSGGYAGYLGQMDIGGGNGGGGGGYGGGGFASNRPGNAMSTTTASTGASYQMEYHDWPVAHPVVLLNPFCRPNR